MRIDSNTYNRLRIESLRTGKSFDELLKMQQTRNIKATDGKEHIGIRHDEDLLQFRCVSRFDEYFGQYHLLLNHCPSEGRRSQSDGAKFKKMGLRAGYPDLVLHLPRHGYGCLGIELKTPTGVQRDTQKAMESAWKANGNMYIVIRSVEQFLTLIQWYIYGTGDLILPEVEKPKPIREKAKVRKK